MNQHAELALALAHCQSAQAEPGDPDAVLDALLDDRIAALIDRLISEHDEAGPETRAILRQISSARML